MLQQLLDNWPLIVLAQLTGVGIVWSVDTLGWKWRRDEEIVFTFNTLGLIVVIPVVGLSALFSTDISQTLQPMGSIAAVIVAWLGWLLLVAWVQKRQFQITLQAAFYGAMMQLGLFIVLACPVGAAALYVLPASMNWFVLTLPVSMLGTYFLLTLFRPQLECFWAAIRQNFRKNQPLR